MYRFVLFEMPLFACVCELCQWIKVIFNYSNYPNCLSLDLKAGPQSYVFFSPFRVLLTSWITLFYWYCTCPLLSFFFQKWFSISLGRAQKLIWLPLKACWTWRSGAEFANGQLMDKNQAHIKFSPWIFCSKTGKKTMTLQKKERAANSVSCWAKRKGRNWRKAIVWDLNSAEVSAELCSCRLCGGLSMIHQHSESSSPETDQPD